MDGSRPSGNSYGEPSRTKKGEWVKSKGEKQIADYFYDKRIKYIYEDQAKTTASAIRDKISRPDFYLPDYSVYVEYWGLVDVGDSNQRSAYQRDMRWKMKQYYDNGLKFISIYPWHLNEFDGAFRAQFKKVLGKDLPLGAVGETLVYALPISGNFVRFLVDGPVANQMSSMELQLTYHPYYFVDYDCFTQGTFLYETENLESKGTLVIDGESGEVVDMGLQSGTAPELPSTLRYLDCKKLESRETPRSNVAEGVKFSKFEAIPAKFGRGEAENMAKVEIAKTLSETYSYTSKRGRVSTKTIRPFASQVKILGTKQSNIPMVTAVFQFKERTYKRVIQASTNHLLEDDLIYCHFGRLHHDATLSICKECGVLFCKDHGKSCSVCGVPLCANHISVQGLVLKKAYCSAHNPAH